MGLLLPLPADAGHWQGRSLDECTAQDAQGMSPEGISPKDLSQDLSGLEELLLPTPPPPTSSNSATSATSATSPTNVTSPSATSPMLLDSSPAAQWSAGPSEATIWSRDSFAGLASVRLVTLQIGDEPSGVAAAAAGSAGQLEAAPSATSAKFMATTPGACAVTKTERPSPASGTPASMVQTAIATGAAAEQPPTVVVGPEAEQSSWEDGAEEHPPEWGFHLVLRGTPLLEMTRRRWWAKTPEGLPPSSRPASSSTHRAATRAEGLPMPLGPPPSPRRHYMRRRGTRSRQRAPGRLTYSAST